MIGTDLLQSQRALSDELPQNPHVAMVVRSFSVDGGLELYTHRVVEKLLDKGLVVTVVCEEKKTDFTHPALNVVQFPASPKGMRKGQRIEHCFKHASEAIDKAGPFDIVHSQHLPIAHADVVTFHNHTVYRPRKVSKGWESAFNDLKVALVPAYQLRDKYDRQLVSKSACSIFPAQVMREDFFQTYSVNAPYVIAHPGSSLAPASLNSHNNHAKTNGASAEPFTFLFVGKGFRKKGLDVLLSACRELKKRGLQFRLHIAGLKAKPLDKLRLNILDLSDRVKYLGYQKDMDAVYAACQVLVLPSRLEPFGMAPLQAMSKNLTAIVSSVCGSAEVLTDGQDSLILRDHLDPVKLADLMQKLMDDGDLLARLQKNASATALLVSYDQTAEATINAYKIAYKSKAEKTRP